MKALESRPILKTMTRPLHILFLLEDLCYGGTQRQMLELLVRLDRKIFAPSVCTLTGPTDLDNIVKDAQIPLVHLGDSRRVPPLFFMQLGSVLRKLAPDIILPCTALPNIWGRILGGILGIPVVGTCRGGGGPKRQYERWLWRVTSRLICNSEALRQTLLSLGVPENKLVCIQNGVDTDRFSPACPSVVQRPPVILCVARLAQDKDHLTLFEAFTHIVRKMPDALLHLVGDGPEEDRLKRWVADNGMADKIIFFPGTTDVRPYYAQARVFALTSEREGQPNVILEAMSCGLPVCATSVGGIPALVEHGKSGLLSPPGDDTSFAQNCLTLLGNAAQAENLGKHGREIVENRYNYDVMVKAHEQVFLEVARV